VFNPSKLLLFCKEMGYPSGTYPSNFLHFTQNTAVLDRIWSVKGNHFPNILALVCTSRHRFSSNFQSYTHILYQLRETTIYAIHVHCSCKMWLKTRYWPSFIHIWTPPPPVITVSTFLLPNSIYCIDNTCSTDLSDTNERLPPVDWFSANLYFMFHFSLVKSTRSHIA
jgi:hypothetical protein